MAVAMETDSEQQTPTPPEEPFVEDYNRLAAQFNLSGFELKLFQKELPLVCAVMIRECSRCLHEQSVKSIKSNQIKYCYVAYICASMDPFPVGVKSEH